MRKVPSWNEYMMNVAEVIKTRSKDPATQVGAVVVDSDRHIIGTGYNGFPANYSESAVLWQRPKKYDIVIHAEMNALQHCSKSPRGSILYTTHYPCLQCAKLIAAAGIKEVVYWRDTTWSQESEELLKDSGILVTQEGDLDED